MNIGQPVWTSFGSLNEGTIAEIHFDPDYVIVEITNGGRTGERITCTSSFLHTTRDGAKQTCEENAEYWQRKADEL